MPNEYVITVNHKTSTAHRVVGHTAPDGSPGKCARLHGHTYEFDVTLRGKRLDETGFVVDFAAVKAILDEWDHRTLLWVDDPLVVVGALAIFKDDAAREVAAGREVLDSATAGVVRVPFNPTAENMARHLAEQFWTMVGVAMAAVIVRETDKTSAMWVSE